MDSFGVTSHQIVSEIIDGEAVILDLRCGRYYTTDDVGAEVWRAATQGIRHRDIADSCRNQFPEQPSVERDIAALLDALVDADLLQRRAEATSADSLNFTWPGEYRAPDLTCHHDLADMMALDPVHDVAPLGWPTPSTT